MDKDDLRDISKDILQELDIVSEEEYLLDITSVLYRWYPALLPLC